MFSETTQQIDESILDKLVDEICDRFQAGESVDLDSLVERHPEMADRLRNLFPTLMAIAEWNPDDGDTESTSRNWPQNPNREIGDFRIMRQIGRGGMGIVYQAEQISVGRMVALKILPLASLINDKALVRFRNEVRAAATLDHPNVVTVYAVGEERGIHYYAMQLVRGQSLAAVARTLKEMHNQSRSTFHGQTIDQIVADSDIHPQRSGNAGPIRESDEESIETVAQGRSRTAAAFDQTYYRNIAQLGIQAARGLAHAHESCVLHRDIKPGNLLLDASGTLFIADFGLARIESDPGITLTGDAVGTLRYMSPEQVQADSMGVDHRTDIYSLGATLYELLTLTNMIDGQGRADIIRRISFEEPLRPGKIRADIPVDLETIVLKATQKNASDRYQNANALADDLQRFLDHQPIHARKPTAVQRVLKWTRRNPQLMWATVLTLLTFTIVFAVASLMINNQKQKAITQQQKAEQRTEFARQVVTDMYMNVAREWLDDEAELTDLQEDFLKKAIAFFEVIASETPHDATSFAQLGESLNAMGMMQNKLRMGDAAIHSLEKAIDSYQRSIDQQFSKTAETGLLEAKANLCHVLFSQAMLKECEEKSTRFINKITDSGHHLEQLTLRPKLQNQLSRLYLARARSRQPEGQPESVSDLEKAVAISHTVIEQHNSNLEFRCQLARSLGYLARGYYAQRDFKKALDTLDQAIEQTEIAIQANPRRRATRIILREQWRNKTLFNMSQGADRPAEAMQASLKSQLLAEELARDFGTFEDYFNLAMVNYHRAKIFEKDKNYNDAEKAYRETIRICRKLIEDYANESARKHIDILARSSFNLSTWLVPPYSESDRSDEAAKLVVGALDIMRPFVSQAESPEFRQTFTNGLSKYRSLLDARDPLRMDIASETVDINQDLANQYPDKISYQVGWAGSLHNLALEYYKNEKYAEAIELYEQAASIQTQNLSKFPDHKTANKFLQIHYKKIVNFHLFCPQKELRNAKRIVEIAGNAVQRWSTNWNWEGKQLRLTQADSKDNNLIFNAGITLYVSMLDLHDPLRAQLQHNLLEIQKQLVKQYPERLAYQVDLGLNLHNLGVDLGQAGEFEKSIELIEQAIDIQLQVLGIEPANEKAVNSRNRHAYSLTRHYVFCPKTALRNPQRAMELLDQTFPDDRGAKELYAIAHYLNGDFENAAKDMENYADLRPDQPAACFFLSACYAKLGQLEKAQIWFDKAEQIYKKAQDSEQADKLIKPYLEEYKKIVSKLLNFEQ